MWKATATKSGASGENFTTLWFDDNLNGVIKKDTKGKARPMQSAGDGGVVAGNTMNDLYNQNNDPGNIAAIWEYLTDDDGDLTAGDLGKADLVSSSDVRKTADDERTIYVESCATGSKYDPDDADGLDDLGRARRQAQTDGTVTGPLPPGNAPQAPGRLIPTETRTTTRPLRSIPP